jgi:hypothetical protein
MARASVAGIPDSGARFASSLRRTAEGTLSRRQGGWPDATGIEHHSFLRQEARSLTAPLERSRRRHRAAAVPGAAAGKEALAGRLPRDGSPRLSGLHEVGLGAGAPLAPWKRGDCWASLLCGKEAGCGGIPHQGMRAGGCDPSAPAERDTGAGAGVRGPAPWTPPRVTYLICPFRSGRNRLEARRLLQPGRHPHRCPRGMRQCSNAVVSCDCSASYSRGRSGLIPRRPAFLKEQATRGGGHDPSTGAAVRNKPPTRGTERPS